MTRHFPLIFIYVIILSTFIQYRQIHCLRRLMRRSLTSDDTIDKMTSDEIRNLVSSSLISNDNRIIDNNKRDTSGEQGEETAAIDALNEDNVASESKDNSMYDDEVGEDDGGQQSDDTEYKRSDDASSAVDLSERSLDQSGLANYDEPNVNEVKDVSKREAKNEEDYDEDSEVDSNVPEASIPVDRKNSRSLPESNNEPQKHETPREASGANSDLDYEKEIEDQIQQRIDSIKEDIKREIEKKQRVREIEANNAKYDELEFIREDLENGEVTKEDSSRSSRDAAAGINVNEKIAEGNSMVTRTKRSDLNEVNGKDTPLAAPIKKRSFERQVTLVEKRNVRDPLKRQSRSASILIPERGHAEVKDELPSDLTLDPNLRLARSNERSLTRNSRSPRYRRDKSNVANDNEAINDEVNEQSNFLFAPREKPDCRTRRRRSRSRDRIKSVDRRKTRKHPRRHSRRHRAIRASSADDEEFDGEERDERDMSIDEDAALEYKESFGGFQSDSSGAGRFKRIKRS